MNEQVIENREKTAQLLWTGFILAFFVIQAIIWTVAITFTANDKSHAVVADYTDKAMNWDHQVAVREASARLGWKTQLNVDPVGDIRKFHLMTIQISDSDDHPLTGANVRLSAFHCGQAGDPQKIELQESKDGVYSEMLQVNKDGHWQFDGTARRGNDVLLINLRQQLKVSR